MNHGVDEVYQQTFEAETDETETNKVMKKGLLFF